MPRVLFVSKPLAPPFHDGTKCLVRDVASNLSEVTPVVLTTREGMALLPRGVTGRAVYRGSGAFSPALMDNARAALALLLGPREELWHFVFAPNPRTGQVARALRAARRVPIVQTVASPPRHFKDLSKLVFGDELVVQSRATLGKLQRAASAEGFVLPPVSVIPPPVPSLAMPSPNAMAQVRRELDIEASARIVLYPGDLEVSSGAAATRALVAPLCERFADAVVVFAYRNKTLRAAECAAELKKSLAGLPVRITDRVRDMHALLAASSVVIFPVDDLWGKVDQPIVLLEAMQLGTPCIVLDQGPLQDVEGALKIATIDAGAWLASVIELLGSEDARSRIVSRARDAVQRFYASGVVARSYEAIYLRLLGSRRS